MSALAHPSGRPHRRRGALIVVGGLVAVLAVLLVIVATTGGRSVPQTRDRLVGQPAPAPLSAARHTPEPDAASAARTFLSGYLAFIDGEASVGQIQDASPHLIGVLSRAHPTPASPGQSPRPRILALGAREASGSVLHIIALVSHGSARDAIGIEIVHEPGGWQITDLSNDE